MTPFLKKKPELASSLLAAGDFQILGSSSSGNAALLRTPSTKVLIDAGFSARRLQSMLFDLRESIENIDAVFLTHEHSDHSHGVLGLSRYKHIQFFANRETALAIESKLKAPLLKRPINWRFFETGASFVFQDLEVTSFSVPHDAYDPVGYIFKTQGEVCTQIGWLTDLGYVPDYIREKIKEVDVLVLESNYDELLLDRDTKRPWSIKQRIKGRHGHLDNRSAFNLLQGTKDANWRHVYLMHISRDCNSIACIEKMIAPLRESHKHLSINIVDPDLGSHYVHSFAVSF